MVPRLPGHANQGTVMNQPYGCEPGNEPTLWMLLVLVLWHLERLTTLGLESQVCSLFILFHPGARSFLLTTSIPKIIREWTSTNVGNRGELRERWEWTQPRFFIQVRSFFLRLNVKSTKGAQWGVGGKEGNSTHAPSPHCHFPLFPSPTTSLSHTFTQLMIEDFSSRNLLIGKIPMNKLEWKSVEKWYGPVIILHLRVRSFFPLTLVHFITVP